MRRPFLTEVFEHIIVSATQITDNPSEEPEFRHLFLDNYWLIEAEVLASHPLILADTYKAILATPTMSMEPCSIGIFALYPIEADEQVYSFQIKQTKITDTDREFDADILLIQLSSGGQKGSNLCLVMEHDKYYLQMPEEMLYQ